MTNNPPRCATTETGYRGTDKFRRLPAPLFYHKFIRYERGFFMPRKKKQETGVLTRAALYVRVSGEEQKIKGLSLEAQQERLEEYARERGWLITGVYIDAAKTARKNIHKREQFQRMIESVKRNEVDVLLFCRLDRWFRSVADYYKVMEILEAHNCGWVTSDEEYDTTTANGRLYINVKLSIAQNEADICGERINVVFNSKISHGTVVSGSCPFGYRVNSEKRLEIVPEQASIIQDLFDFYEAHISKYATTVYVREEYGVNWSGLCVSRLLSNELYTGVYNRRGRYNPSFCPPIIEREQFERVQDLIRRNARKTPAKRTFIFSSMLVCEECRHKMTSISGHKSYYRCPSHTFHGKCEHARVIREDYIEQWLFEHLADKIIACRKEYELKAEQRKKNAASIDKAALKSKLAKLKNMYLDDTIDYEDYKRDYELYSTALKQLEDTPIDEQLPNFAAAERITQHNFREIYENMSQEEKRALWRTAIKEIRIDRDNNITSISFT